MFGNLFHKYSHENPPNKSPKINFVNLLGCKYRNLAENLVTGSVYDLTNNLCLNDGNKKRIVRDGVRAVSTAFEKLVLASRRLLAAIDKNRNGANKDLEKFAREVNDLAGRWEK